MPEIKGGIKAAKEFSQTLKELNFEVTGLYGIQKTK
jgi:hypothetical protein